MSSPRPKIWIVDDSPTEALITERSLGTDFDFERFADGAIAVERLASQSAQPDVMLLDWVMPGMSGDEVCRYLRSNPRTVDLPVILVTASRVETEDIVNGLSSGANDYVARPFAAQELRARVDAVLRAKSLREAASQERVRLDAVNRVGHALLASRSNIAEIVERLATTLTATLCDGCSVVLLPGPYPATSIARHRADPEARLLAQISSLADPAVHAFRDTAHARAALPPAYHGYLDAFGLRSLAILPFPISDPIQGVVTVTRDGGAAPFEPQDISTIETCIEYAALAVQNAMRFAAERSARDQLHAVLEHLPIGIIATDVSGAVTLVNAAASEILPGVERAAALEDVARLATWSAVESGSADWLAEHAQHTDRPGRAALRATLASGEARTLNMASVPLRDPSGALAGSVTALEDVTEAQRIAVERENVARFHEQMLGIVGHDLRNPLNAVLMGLTILGQTAGADPGRAPVLKRLESSAHRMTKIVEQLLDVTHARLGGGIPMQRRAVELSAVVRATVEELTLAYPKNRFEFIATGPVTGVWDPDRLSQVVSNLASNAAQYGAPGTSVTVQLSRDDTTVTITVANVIRDRPISPELIATLFDPYRRGRDERHPGLGLGLYIVHEIVAAHGGRIDVESSLPTTRFRVTLPIDRR